MFFQRFGVGVVDRFHIGEIFFETRSIETRLVQILRCTNEYAGASTNGISQSAKVTASFGCEEN